MGKFTDKIAEKCGEVMGELFLWIFVYSALESVKRGTLKEFAETSLLKEFIKVIEDDHE